MTVSSLDHPMLLERRPPWCLEHHYQTRPACAPCARRGLPAPHWALARDLPHTQTELRAVWDAWFERMGPEEFRGWSAAFSAYWRAYSTNKGSTRALSDASAAYFAWEDDAGGDLYYHLSGERRDRT